MAGLVLRAAPLGTGTDVTVDPTPGVAVPVVVAGPITDTGVGAADGLLPDVADFGPALVGSDSDETTAAAPDDTDFDPISLDSVWAHGRDTTAAIPTDAGGVVGGASGRELGTGASADDDLFAGVVDFDPASAWGDGDEATTAIPSAVGEATVAAIGAAPAVATTITATGVKRKQKRNHTAQGTRKDQRRRFRLYMAALRAQTRVLTSGSPTIHRAAQGGGRGGWRCG